MRYCWLAKTHFYSAGILGKVAMIVFRIAIFSYLLLFSIKFCGALLSDELSLFKKSENALGISPFFSPPSQRSFHRHEHYRCKCNCPGKVTVVNVYSAEECRCEFVLQLDPSQCQNCVCVSEDNNTFFIKAMVYLFLAIVAVLLFVMVFQSLCWRRNQKRTSSCSSLRHHRHPSESFKYSLLARNQDDNNTEEARDDFSSSDENQPPAVNPTTFDRTAS
eukprot:Sdes_comp19913_c0_seq2m12333